MPMQCGGTPCTCTCSYIHVPRRRRFNFALARSLARCFILRSFLMFLSLTVGMAAAVQQRLTLSSQLYSAYSTQVLHVYFNITHYTRIIRNRLIWILLQANHKYRASIQPIKPGGSDECVLVRCRAFYACIFNFWEVPKRIKVLTKSQC